MDFATNWLLPDKLPMERIYLTSGRIESSAAFNLFLRNPFGYGPGVVPNFDDVIVAKTALQATGANLEAEYVTPTFSVARSNCTR